MLVTLVRPLPGVFGDTVVTTIRDVLSDSCAATTLHLLNAKLITQAQRRKLQEVHPWEVARRLILQQHLRD